MMLAALLLQAAVLPSLEQAKAMRREMITKLGECVQRNAIDYVLRAHVDAGQAVTAAFGKCGEEADRYQAALITAATPEGGSLWSVEQAELLFRSARQNLTDVVVSRIMNAQIGR